MEINMDKIDIASPISAMAKKDRCWGKNRIPNSLYLSGYGILSPSKTVTVL